MKQLSKILFSPLRFLCWEAAHGWRERMLLLSLQSWRKDCQAFRKPLCSWIQTLLGGKDATFWKPHFRGSSGMRSFLLHQPRAHKKPGKLQLCYPLSYSVSQATMSAYWGCNVVSIRYLNTTILQLWRPANMLPTCQQSLKEAKQEKIKWYPQLRTFCAGGTRQATLVLSMPHQKASGLPPFPSPLLVSIIKDCRLNVFAPHDWCGRCTSSCRSDQVSCPGTQIYHIPATKSADKLQLWLQLTWQCCLVLQGGSCK